MSYICVLRIRCDFYMDDIRKKREEALARVNAAKKRKREIAAELEKEMKTQYEKETGKKANYFFVL